MHIAIAITIAITLAAALAPMQQAHGWAQSCADGNTDVCCHLEQHGWTIFPRMALTSISIQILSKQLNPLKECDLSMQAKINDTVPLMCQTDCWGGAIAFDGSSTTMPTQAEVLSAGCAVHSFVNGTCAPAQSSSSTASASVSSTASASVSSTASADVSSTASAPVSSSTASATESSSSTATNTDGGAGASASMGPAAEDSVGAAAPHAAGHWAFALACALVLWH
jgi:hypothetical protein